MLPAKLAEAGTHTTWHRSPAPCCALSWPQAADNVPGVAGIGPKTAAALLKEYGTLDSVLEHAANVKPKKAAAQLVSGEKEGAAWAA